MTTSGSTPAEELTYRSAGFSLRAPRVAVIFEGGDDWQFWALSAMHDLTRTWGGLGLVLVPHRNGKVTPAVAAAVRAYDPDYITAAPKRLRALEALHPGTVRERANCCSDEQAEELLRTSGDQTLSDPLADNAVRDLREWCSVYRRHEGDWDYDSFTLTANSPVIGRLWSEQAPPVAVPPSWRGPAALAAAVSFGVLEEPTAGATELDEKAAADLLAHVWRPDQWHKLPPELVFNPAGIHHELDPAKLPSALQGTAAGLAWVGKPRSVTTTLRFVVGDDADDFALAMILNRLSDNTFWMHPSWLPDGDALIGQAVLETTRSWLHSPARWTVLSVGSTTLSAAELRRWVDALRRPDRSLWISDAMTGKPVSRKERWRIDSGGPLLLPDHERNLRLAAADQFDQHITVPVVTGLDGSVEIAASLPIPRPAEGTAADLPYQVDLSLDGSSLPTGRGFDAHTMFADEKELWPTWVRSGRDAVSYQARRFDFVPAGATTHGRLATPRFRLPGLQGWIEQMAAQAGYQVVLSGAGHKSALLARLWGGRAAVTAAIGGPLRQTLQEFAKPPKGSKDSYLDGQAVRLGQDRGVLTFDGIRGHWPDGTPVGEVRELIDALTTNGVLRRGLLLKCPGCTLLDFAALGDLAQTSTCSRCGGNIPVTQASWKHPVEEPTWFYDAHPLAASLIATNSDVPFLLAGYLSKAAIAYADVGEIEFHHGRKSRAEIDLIAHVDDRLVVAEAKSNSTLGTGNTLTNTINKRLLAAQILRADEVIFATTERAWSQATITAVHDAVGVYAWEHMTPPTARMIACLGGSPIEVLA